MCIHRALLLCQCYKHPWALIQVVLLLKLSLQGDAQRRVPEVAPAIPDQRQNPPPLGPQHPQGMPRVSIILHVRTVNTVEGHQWGFRPVRTLLKMGIVTVAQ